ncbi:MAG: hypothetical protein F4Y01_14800 [Gammaproteobacteria bacterium]|nr:hypothetical protein [Gammaproteobacteria bacterium]
MADLALTVNVLGVREDGEWCAIALEMSLRGYGATFDEALAQLEDAIVAQTSFAVQHDTVDQIFIPAEPQYFKLYADLKREALKRELLDRPAEGLPDYRVGDIPLPQFATGSFEVAIA